MKAFFNVSTIALLIIIFCSKHSYSKENLKDSIAEKQLSKIDSAYKSNQIDKIYPEIIDFFNYLEDSKLDSYKGQAHEFLGHYYNKKSAMDSANICFIHAAEAYKKFHDTISEGIMNIRVAFNYNQQRKPEEALFYYKQGIDILNKTEKSFWKGLAHDHAGFILFKQGDYFNALQHYQLAINEFELSNNNLNIGNLYNKIGITYRKTKDKEKEEEAYLLSIEHFLKTDTTQRLGQTYNNLAELYIDKGMIKQGLQMLENAKVIFEQMDYPIGLCGYYSVLGYYHSKKNPPEYDKVIEFMNKAMTIAEEYGDLRQWSDGSQFLGEAYLRTGQPRKALLVLNKGYKIAVNNQFEHIRLQIANMLYQTYKRLNNSTKALEYLEVYSSLNDTVLNENKIKEFTQLDMSFKFKQEQIRDSIVQVQKNLEVQLQFEKEIQRQKRSQLILFFTVLLIALIALFIFIYARRRKKQAATLDQKNKIINQALDEKVLLLEEVHHRVKNNFQLVSSLLELQSKEIEDKKALKTISEGQNRVRAMALIHQKLYENDDIKNINFKDYCTQLVKELKGVYGNNKYISTTFDIEESFFDIDTAIPLGLILNELVTNAFKYAFNETKDHYLHISLTNKSSGNYLLVVKDNGPGIPKDTEMLKMKSLGLRLTTRLSKQLHGNFSYTCKEGCVFSILFKDTLQRKESE